MSSRTPMATEWEWLRRPDARAFVVPWGGFRRGALRLLRDVVLRRDRRGRPRGGSRSGVCFVGTGTRTVGRYQRKWHEQADRLYDRGTAPQGWHPFADTAPMLLTGDVVALDVPGRRIDVDVSRRRTRGTHGQRGNCDRLRRAAPRLGAPLRRARPAGRHRRRSRLPDRRRRIEGHPRVPPMPFRVVAITAR